eukprot:PhF_6_TR7959/c0_g1_i2/m.12052
MSSPTTANHAIETAKDLFAGTVAGMTAKLLEYPFDTVKVRLQDAHSKYKGAFDCMQRMWVEEGVHGFYRGVAAPVLGNMIEIGIAFMIYNRLLASIRHFEGLESDADVLLPQYMLAGFGAGCVTSVVLTPIELVKCIIQVQDTLPPKERIYKGVFDCGVQIARKDGFLALFRGFQSFAAREAPGNACWYGSYEFTRSYLAGEGRRQDLALYKVALAGGIAGFSYWTAFFPADVVKTRIQVDKEYANHNLLRGLRDVYREGGVRALYCGYVITISRAIPSHALLFCTYEVCKGMADQMI